MSGCADGPEDRKQEARKESFEGGVREGGEEGLGERRRVLRGEMRGREGEGEEGVFKGEREGEGEGGGGRGLKGSGRRGRRKRGGSRGRGGGEEAEREGEGMK